MSRSLQGLALRVAREPLVHFLAAGAAICLLSRATGPAASPGAATVVVSRADVDRLADEWHQVWQRPPTQPELDELIETYVRQEILCREAEARGLDRDDAIIRRRLVQMMELLAEGATPIPEPTDEQLATWLAEHEDAFRRPGTISLVQIYLDPRAHRDAAADARALLGRLNDASQTLDPRALSDPAAEPLPYGVEDAPVDEVEQLFGAEFAKLAMAVEPGRWAGPIESAQGLHLVLVRNVTPPSVPELARIRPSVRRDWIAAQRRAVVDEMYRRVKPRYRVVVEPPTAVEGP